MKVLLGSVVATDTTGYPKKRSLLEAEMRRILDRPAKRESIGRIQTLLKKARKK